MVSMREPAKLRDTRRRFSALSSLITLSINGWDSDLVARRNNYKSIHLVCSMHQIFASTSMRLPDEATWQSCPQSRNTFWLALEVEVCETESEDVIVYAKIQNDGIKLLRVSFCMPTVTVKFE